MCAESQIRYSSETIHTLAAKLAQSTDPADLRASQELRKVADTLWEMDKARVGAERAADAQQEHVQGILASVETEAEIGGLTAAAGQVKWSRRSVLTGRVYLEVVLCENELRVGRRGDKVLLIGEFDDARP